MLRKSATKVILILASLCAGVSSYAQTAAYTGFTPYSVFGIGELNRTGSAYNMGMGGVGIATRNVRYMNYLNPASITARDSLSFMAEMSLAENNMLYRQGDRHSVNNTFNVSTIALSFPVYKSSAMMFGVAPYSSTGYQYSYILDDPAIVGNTGNAVYASTGEGGLTRAFAAAGVTFWNRLSLGAEWDLYFGNITKLSVYSFAKDAYCGIESGHNLELKGTSARFGLQYEQPIGQKVTVGVGATYSLGSDLHGYVTEHRIASGTSQNDTLRFRRDTIGMTMGGVNIPKEYGVGLSVRYSDTWRAEINYSRSDWTHSGMEVANGFAVNGSSVFGTALTEAYRVGFEITPNRNDVRYFLKTCTYRIGAYSQKSYYLVDGNQVKDIGLTLGASIPVFRYYNAVTLAVAAGQRGTTTGNMIRERYINFTVGFNFHDYWFRKTRYE